LSRNIRLFYAAAYQKSMLLVELPVKYDMALNSLFFKKEVGNN